MDSEKTTYVVLEAKKDWQKLEWNKCGMLVKNLFLLYSCYKNLSEVEFECNGLICFQREFQESIHTDAEKST